MYGCCTYDTVLVKQLDTHFPRKSLQMSIYVDRLHATNVRMRQRDILNLIIHTCHDSLEKHKAHYPTSDEEFKIRSEYTKST